MYKYNNHVSFYILSLIYINMVCYRSLVGTSCLPLYNAESLISLSLSPNLTLSDNLQERRGTKKPSSEFLVTTAAPPLKLTVAQDPA